MNRRDAYSPHRQDACATPYNKRLPADEPREAFRKQTVRRLRARTRRCSRRARRAGGRRTRRSRGRGRIRSFLGLFLLRGRIYDGRIVFDLLVRRRRTGCRSDNGLILTAAKEHGTG